MKGKTRAFNNQWILQAHHNLHKARYNLFRVSEKVAEKGSYLAIQDTIIIARKQIDYAQQQLYKLQSLFNDPRAKRIEV